MFILKKLDKSIFSSKKGEVGKIMEEVLHRETKLFLFLIFVFINRTNIKIQGIIRVTSFNKYIL